MAIMNIDLEWQHLYRQINNRIVGKHGANSNNYRNNFKDHLLIFFVFDETSGVYFETETEMNNIEANHSILGKPHFHMYDRVFLESIKESGADYFVWYRPFNHVQDHPDLLPKTVVYDVKKLKNTQ